MKKVLVILIGNIIYDARVSKEINSLKQKGYQVVLVQSEYLNQDIENIDFPLYVISKRRSSGMTLGKLIDIIKFQYQVNEIIKREKPDYIHCNDISGLLYAIPLVRKYKVVYDSHELATECCSGWMKYFIYRLEKYLIPKLHAIIIPQIDRLKFFSFKYPKSLGKLYLLENYPTKFQLYNKDFFKEELSVDRGSRKLVLYTGALNDERKVRELVYAVSEIDEFCLVLIGFASEEYRKDLEILIDRLKIQHRVFLFKPLKHEVIKTAAMSADIGVCFYDDPNLNSYFNASNKLYELMNSGTLVLTNDTVGAARVLKKENGICIPSTSVEHIKLGLYELEKLPSAPKMNFWWESQDCVLEEIYQ